MERTERYQTAEAEDQHFAQLQADVCESFYCVTSSPVRFCWLIFGVERVKCGVCRAGCLSCIPGQMLQGETEVWCRVPCLGRPPRLGTPHSWLGVAGADTAEAGSCHLGRRACGQDPAAPHSVPLALILFQLVSSPPSLHCCVFCPGSQSRFHCFD